MKLELYCTIIINTNHQEKAEILLRRFQKDFLPDVLSDLKIEPYWKVTHKHRAEFSFLLQSEVMPEHFLNFISKISHDWNLTLPTSFDASKFEVSCVSEKISMEAIEWVNLETRRKL